MKFLRATAVALIALPVALVLSLAAKIAAKLYEDDISSGS